MPFARTFLSHPTTCFDNPQQFIHVNLSFNFNSSISLLRPHHLFLSEKEREKRIQTIPRKHHGWRRSPCHRSISTRDVDEHGILRHHHRLSSQVRFNKRREKERKRTKHTFIIQFEKLSNLVEINILSTLSKVYLTSNKPISQGRLGNPGCRLASYHYYHYYH